VQTSEQAKSAPQQSAAFKVISPSVLLQAANKQPKSRKLVKRSRKEVPAPAVSRCAVVSLDQLVESDSVATRSDHKRRSGGQGCGAVYARLRDVLWRHTRRAERVSAQGVEEVVFPVHHLILHALGQKDIMNSLLSFIVLYLLTLSVVLDRHCTE